MNVFHKRQGQMDTAKCYFYTDTIINFKNLLLDDHMKMIIINSWQYLTQKNLVEIYGYVIMPNHIHLLWNILKLNGKESPAGSFTKYTAHEFKKYLQQNNPGLLQQYQSDKNDRSFQFWKRDPLAIPISTKDTFFQKLHYVHYNPTKEKWGLVTLPENYPWSSAGFYNNGHDEYNILTRYE
jgi:putative transposase